MITEIKDYKKKKQWDAYVDDYYMNYQCRACRHSKVLEGENFVDLIIASYGGRVFSCHKHLPMFQKHSCKSYEGRPFPS